MDSPNTEAREQFEEFTIGSSTYAMISDAENEHAWIQSNVTMPVER